LRELLGRLGERQSRSSWLVRNGRRLMAMWSRHRENAGAEVGETRQLLDVARRLLVEREEVSPEELEQARLQLLDVLRAVPASAIIAGTFMIPLPGAQPIPPPVLMERLGLLPSSWREETSLTELRDLIVMSREAGLEEVARGLEEILQRLRRHEERKAQLAQYARQNPDWRVFFDDDFDQRLSEEELEHLQERIGQAARAAVHAPDDPAWMVFYRGDNGHDKRAGPLSFNELRAAFPDSRRALVRYGDGEWWVPLWAVLSDIGG